MLSVGFMHNFLQIKNVSLNDHKTIKTFSPLHGFSLFAYWRITVVTVFIFACLPFSNDVQYNYFGFCGCAVFIRPTDVKCVVLTKAAKPVEQ